MNVHEACALLGVGPDADFDTVRLAYRRLIRELHPDRAGDAATDRAATLNHAYAVLSRARGGAGLREPRAAPRREAAAKPPRPSPRAPVHIHGDDILLIEAPPNQAFTALLEAGHTIGSVSYVDRSCAIFEVVVRHDGEACSLVVTLQQRAGDEDVTEAYCTLEAMERVASPSPEPIVRQLAAAMRSPWITAPHHS